MKFNHREEIKNILEMNIEDSEKKNLIAELKTTTTNVARTIATTDLLNVQEGQVIDNLGNSWEDMNEENNTEGFIMENDYGDIEYVFRAENVEGYKVQYFGYDYLVDILDIDEEIAEDLEADEVYQELMYLLGSDGDMYKEAEILISNNQKFEILEINDGRKDEGYIEVILKVL